jgi:hypothetical protein
MPNFVKIAERLDIAPALAEIAAQPDHVWLRINADALAYIPLLTGACERQFITELPHVWRLIDRVLAILAAEHDDRGALVHCRIGRMPPGAGLEPHFDGIDGIAERRYQLALASPPGTLLTVGGEAKWPRPGECWRIAAARTHSVFNHGERDRITILFDTRAR